MSHTPGPWIPVRSITCGHLRAEHNHHTDPREEWTDEDLLLIAAAPDLLAFVQKYADDCVQSLTLNGDDPETFAPYLNARDLINKATGAQVERVQ